MARYTLTVRHGPRVSHERHDSLAGAVEAMRAHAARIGAEGGLPEVSMLRTFGPADRVEARLEITGGRLLGRRTAGVDLMGDGSLVPFSGGVLRRPIEPQSGEDHFDAVASALRVRA